MKTQISFRHYLKISRQLKFKTFHFSILERAIVGTQMMKILLKMFLKFSKSLFNQVINLNKKIFLISEVLEFLKPQQMGF